MTGLIIMRFLAGIGGSAAMAIAPAIVADLYPIERRSFAMGIVLVRLLADLICSRFSLTIISSSKLCRQLLVPSAVASSRNG